MALINAFEPELEHDSDAELRERMDELRERAADGESLDALLPECFAIVREVGKRKMGMRHFDVQMIGAMALARWPDRRDEDRRGQDPDGDARGRAELARRARGGLAGGRAPAEGRAPGDRQRLPGQARRGMDEPDLRGARRARRRAAEHAAASRRSTRPTRATSCTAPTRSSASTTCATTWPPISPKRSSAGTPSRSSMRSTTS